MPREAKYSPRPCSFAGNQDSNSVLIPVTSEDTSGEEVVAVFYGVFFFKVNITVIIFPLLNLILVICTRSSVNMLVT